MIQSPHPKAPRKTSAIARTMVKMVVKATTTPKPAPENTTKAPIKVDETTELRARAKAATEMQIKMQDKMNEQTQSLGVVSTSNYDYF